MTWEVVVTVTAAALVHGLCARYQLACPAAGGKPGRLGGGRCHAPRPGASRRPAQRGRLQRGVRSTCCAPGGLGDVVLHPRPLSRRQTGGGTADWRNHPATDGTTGRADMIFAAAVQLEDRLMYGTRARQRREDVRVGLVSTASSTRVMWAWVAPSEPARPRGAAVSRACSTAGSTRPQ